MGAFIFLFMSSQTTSPDTPDLWLLPELRNYCKRNKLRVGGNKPDVLHRVQQHMKEEESSEEVEEMSTDGGEDDSLDELEWTITNIFEAKSAVHGDLTQNAFGQALDQQPALKDFLVTTWKFLTSGRLKNAGGQEVKISFEDGVTIVESSLWKQFPSMQEWYNEYYQKTKLNGHLFFLQYAIFLRHTNLSEPERLKYLKQFFRSTKCQKLYHRQPEYENYQTSDPKASDHIIAQSIIYHFVHKFLTHIEYSWDYFCQLRTVMNQHWNFQPLSQSQNSCKASIEKKINRIIDSSKTKKDCINKLKQNDDICQYFAHGYRALAKKKGERFLIRGRAVMVEIHDFIKVSHNLQEEWAYLYYE